MIRYLKHSEIDKSQWDVSIDKSMNRLVYAKSWFLDLVSPEWDALVESDYQMVMPLPVKSKFFLPYLVQPVFTQQLGVFSSMQPRSDDVLKFLNQIPKKFLRQIINLNSCNLLPSSNNLKDRTNYELNLDKSFNLLYQGFNENTKRNIRKAISSGISLDTSQDKALFINHFKTQAKERPNQFELTKLTDIVSHAVDHQSGEIVLVRNKGGEVISGAFFLTDMDRIIYVTSFVNSEGLENSAMFLVMSEMIKKHAMKPVIFDFEGSMIPGVARFFAGFGAEKKVYQQYRRGW